MPVREKQPERAGSRPVVPVSGLVQAHSPAESRVFAPVGMEGTSETDWLPEGAGFEPSVPRLRRSSVRCRPQLCSLRRLEPTPVSSLPRSQADMLSATMLKSKNPVEFRPWSYEFDGNRNARAMW